jgi:hypothetical protein
VATQQCEVGCLVYSSVLEMIRYIADVTMNSIKKKNVRIASHRITHYSTRSDSGNHYITIFGCRHALILKFALPYLNEYVHIILSSNR